MKKKNSRPTSKEQNPLSTNGENSAPENESSSSDKKQKKKRSDISLDRVPNYDLRNRAEDAIDRLGVDRKLIPSLPPINKLLKEQSRSGISGAIEAMRMSDGEISQQFLAKYDQIPERDKESLTLEVIALAAGVDARALLGEILLAYREYSALKYKFRILESHPEILEKRIEYAKLVGGYRDRDAVDTILGALPRSKTTFIDKFYAGSETTSPDPTESDGEEIEGKGKTLLTQTPEEMVEDENFVFPDCEVMQEKIQPIRQKLLESKR